MNYLRDHPMAKDTVEGIARWWVNENKVMVRAALKLLIEENVMEKHGKFYQLVQGGSIAQQRERIDRALRRLKSSK